MFVMNAALGARMLRREMQPSAPRAEAGRLPIYVEVSPLLSRQLAGIGRLVARLIEALLRIQPLRLFTTIQGDHARNMRLSNALRCGQEIELSGEFLPPADRDLESWARQLFRRPLRPLDEPLLARCAVLYTMLRPPVRRFRRELCLLYDFTPVLLPGVHVAETRQEFGELFSRHVLLCDQVVAISESTGADACWLTRLPRERVVVGRPGPSLCVTRHASPRRLTRKKNLILVVSTLEPRKNAVFLLRWFLTTRVLPPDTELWWVGPHGWLFMVNAKSFGANPRTELVQFLGTVSDSELCELYRQASFTIYPSLYEGFGFPVLDSLRHGTPVLCSFNSSLAEFAGPGVFYFDAGDPTSLDSACRDLLASGAADVARTDLDDPPNWDRLARTIVSLCTEQSYPERTCHS
jgi:glycosyltransferase involved in cell wall biosynthesis